MKTKAFLFFALITFFGCVSLPEQYKDKKFYRIQEDSYSCKVRGPLKIVYVDYRGDVALKEIASNKVIGDFPHSDIKLKQTITSVEQLKPALKKRKRGCAWNIAVQRLPALIEESVYDKEWPIIKKAIDKEAKISKKKAEEEKIRREADCKIAKEKANKRRQEIKTELGLDPEGELYWIPDLVNKVVDFADNGVFIENDCSEIHRRNMLLYSLPPIECQEERRFVYTSDDYVKNESFRSNGLIYIRAANYKYITIAGSQNSVMALKSTQYKASNVHYSTYLKNKDYKCD